MKALVVGAMSGVVGAAGGEVGTGGLTQVLLALLGGGVVTLVVSAILNRRKDGVQLSSSAIQLVRDSLEAVAEMREELDELNKKLADVQRALAGAQKQIAALEAELATAKGDRSDLVSMLASARDRERDLRTQVDDLQHRMAAMAEALAGRDDRPPEPH